MNSTAPGWILLGTAQLTSGGVDPAGAGWLRLTSNAGNQAGTAIYNTPFSSAAGVQVIFTYATYSFVNAPGDGISFYLIDGATAVPTVGSYGGPLGYSKKTTSPTEPGVTNGYLGIGLDEYGNFGTSQSGDCSYVPCSAGLSGVTIRGSGSLSGPGFNYYTQAAAAIPTGSRAGAKKVRITITPAPTVSVTVEIDSGSGFVTVINNFNISGIAGQAAIPATFKMGFAAGTGWATDYHEIRGFTTTNANPASQLAFVQQPTTTIAGQPITPAVTVQLQDSGGSPVIQGGVTMTVSLSSGTGTLGGTLSKVTDGSGLATFNDLSINLVGSKQLTAASAGLTSAVSNPFTITAGAAVNIVATGGTPQSAPISTQFAQPLQVTVTDTFGNPVVGALVTYSAPGSGPSASLSSGGSATTDASGHASVTATANGIVGGPYLVSAATGTLPPVTFSLTNLPAAAAEPIPVLDGVGLAVLAALLAAVAFNALSRQ